jgi:ankyrin repeat protein
MDLWTAAQEGREKDVQALLDDLTWTQGVRRVVGEALHVAVANDHLNVVKLLVQQDTINYYDASRGRTPLGTAARHGNTGVAAFLVAAKAHANLRDRNNWTPLQLAVTWRHVRVASCLLACKASQSVTHLLSAAASDDVDMVSLLLGQKADVNTANEHGLTALHVAAALGHVAVVTRLLRAAAQVAAVTENGETPLDFARSHGRSGVLALLLQSRVAKK